MDTTNRKQKILIFIIIILISISLLRTVVLLWDKNLPDFIVVNTAAHRILEHKNPYINSVFTQVNYLPIFLIFISPFTVFDSRIASNLWLLLSVISFLFSILILYKIKKIPFILLFLFIFLSIISFPFKFTLGMGQTNFILLLLICLFIYKIIKSKDLLAGVFLSLSIVIKLTPLLFVPYLFINRNIKTLTFSLLSLLVFLLIPFFLLGRDTNIYYFNHVFLPLIKESAGRVYYNQSITGFFSRLSLDASLLNITRIVIVCFSLWTILKKKMGYFSSVSLLTIMFLLINNFTWQHHLILLILPFYFLVTKRKYFPSLISYSFVFFNIKNIPIYNNTLLGNILLSHGFLGVFFLWFIFVWNLKESEVK